MKSPGKKTILITGATGFIGSNFINTLGEKDYEIIGIKRNSESIPRVPIKRHIHWVISPLEEIPHHILKTADAVVHLASHSANHPYDTLYNCIDQNVIKHLKFIENAIKNGVKRFLFAGSCFEYGNSGIKYEYIPIDAPLEPYGSYPVSKAMFFLAVKELFSGTEMAVSYQRIFQVYGEGEAESRFWPTLKQKAFLGEDMLLTEGDQIRDFIDVSEVAEIFKTRLNDLIETETSFFKVENLASGSPQTLKEFAKFWWSYWGAKGNLLFGAIPYRDNEVMRFVPDLRVNNNE
jgi:nucleoside-diphosphate-sugar epimerase